MLTYYSVSALINASVSLALGIFIIYKNPKGRLNQNIFLWCLTVVAWSSFYFVWQIEKDGTRALLWTRLLMVGGVWAPFTFFNAAVSFLSLEKRNRKLIVINFALSLFFTVMLITPYMVNHVEPLAGFDFWPKPGFLYAPFLIFFMGLTLYSAYLAYSSLKNATPTKRSQTKLMLYGMALSILGGSSNYFLWYNIPIKPYGNVLVLAYALMTVYAIALYKLLDIKFVLRSSLVYILSLFTIILPAVIIKLLLGTAITLTSWIDLAIIIFAIAVFPKVKEYFYKIANKYLFSSLYDSAELIATISDKLRMTLDIDKIDKDITDSLTQAFHCKAIGIMNYSRRNKKYNFVYNNGFPIKNKKHIIINGGLHKNYILKNDPILVHELKQSKKFKGAVEMFDNLGIDVLVPLNVKEKTIGLIALGEKESGDLYNNNDMEVLGIISAQAAIAIENSLLYEQTRKFTKTLQVKIEGATKQIRKQNTELQKLDKLKDEFISVASHQLRTPLTATRWALEFLINDNKGKLNRRQMESVKELESTNAKLIKLVNSLLNISRIDEGRLSITPVPTDVVAVMKEIMHEFEPIARHKNLKVVTHYEKLPKIKLDPTVVNKAIHNFVSNAIKYNKDGGHLWINVEKFDKDNLLIKVRDEGIGIPVSEQKNLFAKFYRASNAATSNTEGTGLGLYIAKSAVESSGGKVWFESKENEGTSFYVTLPLRGSRARKGEKSLV